MRSRLLNLLTAPRLARMLGADLKTIHNWVNRGEIKFFRTPGRHLRFRSVDAIEFMERCGYPVPPELARAVKPQPDEDTDFDNAAMLEQIRAVGLTNRQHVNQLILAVKHCDEEVDADGMCSCAHAIGEALAAKDIEINRLEGALENYGDMNERDTETVGILADVVDILFDDETRCEKHAYEGVLERARECAAARKRMDEARFESDTGEKWTVQQFADPEWNETRMQLQHETEIAIRKLVKHTGSSAFLVPLSGKMDGRFIAVGRRADIRSFVPEEGN